MEYLLQYEIVYQEAIESLSLDIALHFAYGNVFSHYEKLEGI